MSDLDRRLRQAMLAESGELRAIPWPCIHEFLAIVTHPRRYDPPTPLPDALDHFDCWLEVPTLVLLSEDRSHWRHLRPMLTQGEIVGPGLHDARIAALCEAHGVRERLTADRGLTRMEGGKVSNPSWKLFPLPDILGRRSQSPPRGFPA